jgi:hypothetical protein
MRIVRSLLPALAVSILTLCACGPEGPGEEPGGHIDSAQHALGTFTLFPFAANSGTPNDVVSYGSYVYWSKGGEIRRISKTPGQPSALLCAACGTPVDLAVSGAYVYYMELGGQNIGAVPVGGSEFPLLIAHTPSPLIVGGGLAADGTHVYWPASNGIYRAPRDGGAAQLFVGNVAPVAIAQDSASIYFLGNGLLRKAAKSTGALTTLASSAPTIQLVVSGGYAYFGNGGTSLRRVATSGGAVTTFATAATGRYASSIGVDGTYLFYTDWPQTGVGTSYIRRASLASPGAAPVTLYSMNAALSPDDLASDGSYLYWGDGNGIKKAERQ